MSSRSHKKKPVWAVSDGLAIAKDGRYVLPTKDAKATCPDCWKPVHAKCGNHKAWHWSHYSKCPSTPSAVSAKHRAMQHALCEKLFNDGRVEHSGGRRRADVYGTHNDLQYVVECQVSPIAVSEMERRTADWNARGAAVLWVFDHAQFRDAGNGLAKVPAWIADWCKRRSWNQGYLMDDENRLWWFLLGDGSTKGSSSLTLPTKLRRVHRSRQRPVNMSQRRMGLIADVNTVNGRDPLAVGAFAWVSDRPDPKRVVLGAVQPNWVSFRNLQAADPDVCLSALAK